MPRWILVQHAGCATAEALHDALRARGVPVERSLQEDLPPGHAWSRLASPALFKDGALVLGDPAPHEGKACARVDWKAWLEAEGL